MAADSLRVHSSITDWRISFMKSMKAFKGFLISGFLGVSLRCSKGARGKNRDSVVKRPLCRRPGKKNGFLLGVWCCALAVVFGIECGVVFDVLGAVF